MKQKIKKTIREIYWAYYGRKLKNPRLAISPKSILYVCKGNICRSPFAERLTNKLLENGTSNSLAIRSAGIDATVANPPPKEAIDAAKVFGVLLEDHRARRLTPELIGGSDMIVAMEVGQLKQLEEAYPESKDRFFLLSMFSHNQHRWGNYYNYYNIADPYGKNIDQYILCYEKLKMCINNILLEIRWK